MTERTESGILYGYFNDTRYCPHQKRRVTRLVQLLPGQGCGIWLDTQAECCIFCRLPAGTRYAVLGEGFEDRFHPWTVPPEDYHAMIDASLENSDGVECITCFNGGSFLTDREVPAAARQHLYRRFAEHPSATELMVESRPEFVSPALLDEAEALIGGKAMKVAIGLESMDDRVRNQVLKKFMGRNSFLRALRLLQERGIRTFVYVFLGAPGLSEREAYEDARASIKALADLGVDEIALSCAFVPPGGMLETWFNAGTFRPPWLWTVTRLIEDAAENGWPLSVGGFDDFPPPVAISMNCGRCDEAVLDAIEEHRQTGAFACSVACACQTGWSEMMETGILAAQAYTKV